MKSESRRPSEGTDSVVHCGEQREPRPHQLRAQDELHAVDVFADWCGEGERPLRIRIYKARDKLMAGANRSKHGRARQFYWLAAQLAADWAFARATVEDLNEILAGLSRTFLTAQMIERLEAPDEQ